MSAAEVGPLLGHIIQVGKAVGRAVVGIGVGLGVGETEGFEPFREGATTEHVFLGSNEV